jgi:type I restriction enzyme S subunit
MTRQQIQNDPLINDAGPSASSSSQQWQWVRVEDLAETCSGTTPSRGHDNYFGGSIPWIKTGELRDNIIDNSEEHVTEKALRETSLKLLPKDTLLIAMYGQGQTRGRTGLLAREATINQACFAILPNEKFDPPFLQLWFQSSYERLRAKTEFRGGNQPNLNGDVLRQELIPLPPLAEQRRIAGRLREQLAEVAKARTAVQAQLAAAQALPAATLREVFDNDHGWESKQLGDVLSDIQAGKCLNCVERRAEPAEWGVLKVSAVTWGEFRPEQNKVVPPDFVVPTEYEVQIGDLLISRSNTTELVGAVVRVKTTRPKLMLSDKTLRLVPRAELAAAEFLEFCLRSTRARQFIEGNSTGASSSMKNITQDTIRNIPVVVPPLDEQRAVAARLASELAEATQLQTSLSDKLATIHRLPAALLAQAFQGGG